MAAEATLILAAQNAYSNMFQWYAANTLRTHMTTFIDALIVALSDDIVADRQVRNWIVLLGSIRDTIPPAFINIYSTYQAAADTVYRTCYGADVSDISAGKKVLVLAAYNTAF